MFSESVITAELKRGFKIPPKPAILDEIEQLSNTPDFSVAELADPLSQDVSLSSAVLKIVNSASNGLNRTIGDITQAVCFLGLGQIKAIVSNLKLRECYNNASTVKLERFWDESAETANLMLYINKWLGKKYLPDTLYTLGLFHDCGIAAMSFKYPDYLEVLSSANDDPATPLNIMENRQYNTDHATVGYYVVSSWHFPKPICQMIRFHHDIDFIARKFPSDARAYITILHIAENTLRESKRFEQCQFFAESLPLFLTWLEMSDDDYADLVEDIESILN